VAFVDLTGLLRARVIVVVAMMATVAVNAGGIFDRRLWSLLIAPIAVGLVAVATMTQRWPIRLTAVLATGLASTAAIVVLSGGTIADVASAFINGPRRILSTDWPSPERGDLIGVAAGALALTTASAAETARRTHLHLAPLLPVVVIQVVVVALSAPLGARLLGLAPLAVLAIVMATLRTGDGMGLRERLTILRGEQRLVAVGTFAVGLAIAASIPIAYDGRNDPRRNDPAELSATLIDPIEATLALQRIDPPIDLHDVTVTAEGPDLGGRLPLRWRTAALSEYDGRRWSPDLTLRPIGRRLAGPSADTVTATVGFLDTELQLVPLPGSPVLVDADVETDPSRTLVRLIDRPDDDTTVEITARVSASASTADPALIASREVNERAGSFTDLATGLAAEGGSVAGDGILTQLNAIEQTMREDFELRSEAPGGGLQQALINRFLRDTRQGNAEQFATSFVLLARSLGVDARVATGFRIDAGRLVREDDVTRFVLDSSDAQVWPEILVGDQWAAFDPVPDEEISDVTTPETEPQIQTPASPQPPNPPPPAAADEPAVIDDDSTVTGDSGLPIVARYVLVGVLFAGSGSMLLLLIAAFILGAKWRRRRNLLMASEPGDRINGAWRVATMRLVDAGLTFTGSDTNHEIAAAGSSEVPTAQREIHRLATLADASTFGSPVRADLLAEDAWRCLGQVEASMAESRDWRRRTVWRLSLRSLRRSTASPV
jgi:hypothetical protein